jgi:hypothetical protein
MERSAEAPRKPITPTLVLSASEIGAYTYCPESWVLDRLHAPQSRLGQRRRFQGSLAHARIGSRIDQLTILQKATRLIGFAILVLLLIVPTLLLGVRGLPQT